MSTLVYVGTNEGYSLKDSEPFVEWDTHWVLKDDNIY